MDTLLTALLDYGAMGCFAGFLGWQFVQLQKQLQTLQSDFAKQVADMQEKSEAQTDKVRDRYDKIIGQKDDQSAKIIGQKDVLFAKLTGKIESDIDHIRATADKLLELQERQQ